MREEIYRYNVLLAISVNIGRTRAWLAVNLLIDPRMR